MDYSFFRNKKILITGHNGFKGAWLTVFLHCLGARVTGVSKDRQGENPIIGAGSVQAGIREHFADILDQDTLTRIIREERPDIIFHLAAQSITLTAYAHPLETFRVNGIGTANILEALRNLDSRCLAVIVTSDKCYRNNEWARGYRENDVLAGLDPYSASKSVAEIIAHSYYYTYFRHGDRVRLSTCRAGNVIGGGDWNRHRIIPDCIRAWQDREAILVRSPDAVRPWNYILDVLNGYLHVAYHLDLGDISGEAFNFGPEAKNEITVLELVQALWKSWRDHSFEPYVVMDENPSGFEHKYLRLNSTKAGRLLNWAPAIDLGDALEDLAAWYQDYLTAPEKAYALATEHIDRFLRAAVDHG